jgi:hypothetical protein
MDTTKNIWEYLFMARVPLLQSMSVEQMRKTGVRVSGNKVDDNNIKNEWLTTYIPISKMVEYYQEGVSVRIVNPSDLPVMYKFISEHLSAWKEQLEYGLNIGNAPIDDLVAMDSFATSVYEHAVHQFTKDDADSLMSKHLRNLVGFDRNAFFNPIGLKKYLGDSSNKVTTDAYGNVHISSDEPEPVPERESMADFFRDRMVGYRRY